jgi:anion-transporting  ArsA/GET3 family ATPase
MPSARSRARRAGLDELLAAKEMVVVCGTGGVGKTTTAAALGAMAAVHLGGRVLVLTVDPARRLATALGLVEIGNEPVEVDLSAVRVAGGREPGQLFAAMLDTAASWDDLIVRHAPDAQVRDTVLANPLYRNITRRFIHSHDYIAMERLYDVHASGDYDLVIIDTPPSRNALSILDAPGRMKEFFGSRLLRWLTVPYRSRLVTFASKPFYQVADRVLGSRFLQDIAEFFVLFQTMEQGFTRRAVEVERLLSDARTSFCLVTTLETAPLAETRFLAAELDRRSLHLGAIVVNRVLPTSLRNTRATRSSRELRSQLDALSGELSAQLGEPAAAIAGVLSEATARFDDLSVVARREADRLAELDGLAAAVPIVPTLDGDIHDLPGLLQLGSYLWPT